MISPPHFFFSPLMEGGDKQFKMDWNTMRLFFRSLIYQPTTSRLIISRSAVCCIFLCHPNNGRSSPCLCAPTNSQAAPSQGRRLLHSTSDLLCFHARWKQAQALSLSVWGYYCTLPSHLACYSVRIPGSCGDSVRSLALSSESVRCQH